MFAIRFPRLLMCVVAVWMLPAQLVESTMYGCNCDGAHRVGAKESCCSLGAASSKEARSPWAASGCCCSFPADISICGCRPETPIQKEQQELEHRLAPRVVEIAAVFMVVELDASSASRLKLANRFQVPLGDRLSCRLCICVWQT